MVGIPWWSGRIGMTEIERRTILEVIDELQYLDGWRDVSLTHIIETLMKLLRVGPGYQENGE